MKHHDFTGILPPQYTGTEIEATASIELSDEIEAKHFFEEVKNRLLYVNNWHEVAGIISARFRVINKDGAEVNRSVTKGDYLKIDIPGPGSTEGDGFDWVSVEELKEVGDENMQSLGFRVRPTNNPGGSKNETAHFYSDEATSNFIITREKLTITAWIVDRNTKPNADVESLTDKIRDTSVGISAIGFFSKLQWQQLANGLVKKATD